MSIEPTNIFLFSDYISLLPESWLVAFCTCSHVDCMITCLWCLNYILPIYIIAFILQEQLPCSRYIFWGPWVACYFPGREKHPARSRYCTWYERRGRAKCPGIAVALSIANVSWLLCDPSERFRLVLTFFNPVHPSLIAICICHLLSPVRRKSKGMVKSAEQIPILLKQFSRTQHFPFQTDPISVSSTTRNIQWNLLLTEVSNP